MAGRKSKIGEATKKAGEYIDGGYLLNDDVIPSISGLALFIKCSRATLYNYADESEEFSYIMDRIKATQEKELINKGLKGEFNATIVKLMLANHGYSEKQSIEQKSFNVDMNKPLSALNRD